MFFYYIFYLKRVLLQIRKKFKKIILIRNRRRYILFKYTYRYGRERKVVTNNKNKKINKRDGKIKCEWMCWWLNFSHILYILVYIVALIHFIRYWRFKYSNYFCFKEIFFSFRSLVFLFLLLSNFKLEESHANLIIFCFIVLNHEWNNEMIFFFDFSKYFCFIDLYRFTH